MILGRNALCKPSGRAVENAKPTTRVSYLRAVSVNHGSRARIPTCVKQYVRGLVVQRQGKEKKNMNFTPIIISTIADLGNTQR